MPGVYGPKTSVPAFWFLIVLFSLWAVAIVTISIIYFCKVRHGKDGHIDSTSVSVQELSDEDEPVEVDNNPNSPTNLAVIMSNET